MNQQPELLSALASTRIRRLPPGSLLVGAGDSYIAAQCAAFLSSLRCNALDPYVLISDPELSRGRTVAFISVSGRTRSNIAAAKIAGRVARRTLAVTADAGSPLARATGGTVLVPYRHKPRVPGTASFTLTLALVLKLESVDCACDFPRLFARAESSAADMRFSEAGLTLFLGNNAAYAVALYAAAKAFEFFGVHAQAELLEEFSHMELFSLRANDAVNIFQSADELRMGLRLANALKDRGYPAALLPSLGRNRVEEVFHSIFLTQLAVTRRMKERNLDLPHFLESDGALGISDSMIY